MKKLLILGGTGFVGQALCETLSRQRPELRLVVPSRQRRRGLRVGMLPTVDVVQADVHRDADLAALLHGCDAVVNLVAILQGDEAAFEAAHVALPRRLAAACLATGVRQLVHVSALGVATDAPSRYLRSKARGEAVLQAACSPANLGLTLLRPSVIFGANDRFLNLFARLQALAPVLPLAGANARFQPVWVNDVAAAIVACLGQAQRIGHTYECAGPQPYTLAELVRLAGRESGHPRPIWPLPEALGRAQAWLLECLPGEPPMSRDNLDSMQVPNVATGLLPGLAALGIEATPLAAVAPLYLRQGRGVARLDLWRARHR